MTTTTDRAAQLRQDIQGCNGLIAYHSANGAHWIADNFRARLAEFTAELKELES